MSSLFSSTPSSFPLYNILKSKIENKIEKNSGKLSDIKVNNLLKFIKENKDKEVNEYLYLIIRKHSLENEIKSLNQVQILPYKCELEGDDITFDFDLFPIELQNLLYTFYELHTT